MCMRNVNLIPVFCDIIPNQDGSSLSLGNFVGKQYRIDNEEEVRKISQISLALFISATQTKDPNEAARIDPDVTFSFAHTYDVKIRLTETFSGAFADLEEFLFEPDKYAVTGALCRKTLNYTRLCVFANVKLPEPKEHERFVIKVLIRRHDDGAPDKSWAVQAILPLNLT